MKHWIKKLLVLGSSFAAAGAVIACLAYFMGASTSVAYANGRVVPLNLEQQEERIQELSLPAFHTIYADVRFDLEVKTGDNYGVDLISYISDASNSRLEYTLKDGVLTLSESRNTHSFNSLIITGVEATRSSSATIYLPKDVNMDRIDLTSAHGKIQIGDVITEELAANSPYGRITVDNVRADHATFQMSNGTLQLKELYAGALACVNDYGKTTLSNRTTHHFNTLDIEANNGSIVLENLTADYLDLTNYYGSVKLRDISTENFRIEMNNGRLETDNTSASSADVTNQYGSVTLRNWASEEFTAQANNGDISLSGTVTKTIQIVNDYGSVKLNLDAPESDYNVSLTTSYGSIKVNGESQSNRYRREHSGGGSIDISGNNGKIDLQFRQ